MVLSSGHLCKIEQNWLSQNLNWKSRIRKASSSVDSCYNISQAVLNLYTASNWSTNVLLHLCFSKHLHSLKVWMRCSTEVFLEQQYDKTTHYRNIECFDISDFTSKDIDLLTKRTAYVFKYDNKLCYYYEKKTKPFHAYKSSVLIHSSFIRKRCVSFTRLKMMLLKNWRWNQDRNYA